MAVVWNLARVTIIAITIMAVAELSKRSPRYGAVLLALPVITILAFVVTWTQHHDLAMISSLAKETLILVILGLPMFLPLIYCREIGLGFWASLGCGVALALMLIGMRFLFAGSTG
jgi:hypothetical protein